MRAMQGCVLYHFMMFFGMTQMWREPATYRMRGRHANHIANPTRSTMLYLLSIFSMFVYSVKNMLCKTFLKLIRRQKSATSCTLYILKYNEINLYPI